MHVPNLVTSMVAETSRTNIEYQITVYEECVRERHSNKLSCRIRIDSWNFAYNVYRWNWMPCEIYYSEKRLTPLILKVGICDVKHRSVCNCMRVWCTEMNNGRQDRQLIKLWIIKFAYFRSECCQADYFRPSTRRMTYSSFYRQTLENRCWKSDTSCFHQIIHSRDIPCDNKDAYDKNILLTISVSDRKRITYGEINDKSEMNLFGTCDINSIDMTFSEKFSYVQIIPLGIKFWRQKFYSMKPLLLWKLPH